MIAGMTNEHKTMHWAIILTVSKKEVLQDAFPDHRNLSEHSNIACDASLLQGKWTDWFRIACSFKKEYLR